MTLQGWHEIYLSLQGHLKEAYAWDKKEAT